MHLFAPTTPAGRPLLTVSFEKLLPAGVAIQSAAITSVVHPLSAVGDLAASTRLDGSCTITSGTFVSQFFKNGVDGCDYLLTFLATFSDGQIEPVQAVISVRGLL